MLAVLADVNRHRQVPIRLREQDLFRMPRKRPVFCHACLGESLAVDPRGAVFPCGQTLGDPYFAAGTVWRPQFDRLAALRVFRPDAALCADCALKPVCPGDCPSRLHYNRHAHQMLVCQLYRTLYAHAAEHVSSTLKISPDATDTGSTADSQH
ncbi:SPASM domain-containing protein [Desulfosarcina cetonica]|uniref:SPASM domain-containing protein n=1 Tax=Desulfosarcina cetonica TaxID=90730 RepID=UPI0009F9D397